MASTLYILPLPLSPTMSAALSQLVSDALKADHATRKQRKKLVKTKCGRCGGGASAAGGKLQTCSRCKSVNYCSAACQREHWRAGHKADCNNFVHPPFAKHFDTSDRADVPWPVDPVFLAGSRDGFGLWVTTHGPLTALLQQAYEALDLRVEPRSSGPPSYERWVDANIVRSGVRGTPEVQKYIGGTIMGLRGIVQNRRQDGRVIAVSPADMKVCVPDRLKGNMLPADLEKVEEFALDDSTNVLLVPPWADYNGALRVGILEINGAEAPVGRFAGTVRRPASGEYQPPAKPSGAPWNRVVDWDRGSVLLGPGDYAVFACHYRLADGYRWKSVPDVLGQVLCTTLTARLLRTTATGSNWCESAHLEVAFGSDSAGQLLLLADMDQPYFEEYFEPYVDESSEGPFVASRFGKAGQMSDADKALLPRALEGLIGHFTPAQREEFARRSRAMGADMSPALSLIAPYER